MKNILSSVLLTLIVTVSFGQTTHTINSGSYYYTPGSLNIALGDSVVWINDGGYHDVNGNVNSVTGQPYNNPETFDSPATNVVGAVIFAYKFTVSGTYNYDCSVGSHAANGMIGTVVVENNTTQIDESINNISFVSYNPQSNALQLNFNCSGDNASILLHNIEGKLIQTNQINTSIGENNQVFNLNTFLKSGIYIVSINAGKHKTTEKFTVN
jgi:plastocyanin